MTTDRKPTDDLQPGEHDHGTETIQAISDNSWKQSIDGIIQYLRAKEKENPGEGIKGLNEILNEGNTINDNLAKKIAALILNPEAEYKLILPEPTHFKFTVWWVDKDLNDQSTVVVAQNEADAISVAKEDENFNYSVRVTQGTTQV